MKDLISDKRSSPRKIIVEKEKAQVEIILPYPKGHKIIKELTDLSDTGFSFRMLDEEGYLVKGTPLKEITLYYKDNTIQLSGEVVYVARIPVGDGLDYKIGVQVSKTIKWQNNGDPLVSYNFRPKRYDFEFLSNLGGVFCYSDKNIELIGEIINISKFGAAFKTKNDLILKPSQTLNNVKIIFRDEIVFSGKVTIINIRETQDQLIVGVSFQDSLIDLYYLTDIKKRADIKENFESFIENLIAFDKIDPEFKAEVMDIRFYLEEIERILKQEEENIKDFDLEKQNLIENEIFIIFQNKLKIKLDQSLTKIHELVEGLSSDDHHLNKHYFQKNLHRFFLQSPFWKRVYKKPLGYAGDYEMISMIVRNKLEGNTLFAKLIHSYLVSTPPAQAVRNRANYLKNKILQKKDEDSYAKDPFRITSIGSGPASEIQEVLPLIKEQDTIEINLFDFDETALNYSHEILFEIQQKLKNKVKINHFNVSIREIIRKGELIHNFPPQNFIYCTGLFDYLSVPICRKLVEVAFSNLKEGGRLIVGNFSESNKIQTFMEYGGEWYLIHRTNKEFLEMVPRGISNNQIIVEKEETGINVFLNIKK